KGGGANAVFAAGIWIGGMVDGNLHVAATTYGPYEFWAGPLDDSGQAPAKCSDFDRVYSVDRYEVARFERTGLATPDLTDWPTGLGAPTTDGAGAPIDLTSLPLSERQDRVINLAAGERPLITGDQMLWWVMNDRGNVHRRSDTPPVGLEVHGSAFAFAGTSLLASTTFYRYRIFNRSKSDLTAAHIGVFVDPDLGNFNDDYVGSDSALGLFFAYNADNHDEGGEGYGEAPPAIGFDMVEVPNPIIAGRPGDEVSASEPKRMGAFLFYNGGSGVTGDPGNGADVYNLLQGQWKDGQRATYGGNGRDFSNVPASYMYPSDPPEYWSEFNSDGVGQANSPADRRGVSATTEFEIPAGGEVTFAVAVITSFGADNLDSVRLLKQDSATIQRLYDSSFKLADPPAAPRLSVTTRDREILLQWSNQQQENNYQDSYEEVDPGISEREDDRSYRFEGYNIYEFESASEIRGKLLAVYDVKNGIKRVAEGEELQSYTALGSDSGVRHFFRYPGLVNYRSYYLGVQAYAYSAKSGIKILKGPVTRVEVIPTASPSSLTTEGEAFLGQSGDNMAHGTGSLVAVPSPANAGVAEVTANLIGARDFVGSAYTVTVQDIDPPPPDSPLPFRIPTPPFTLSVSRADGTLAYDGKSLPLLSPTGIDVLRFDGLSLNVTTTPPAILSIEVVSNNAGALTPPVGGAPGWLGYPGAEPVRRGQQANSNASWLLVTGQSRLCPASDCSSYETFLDRTVQQFGGWHAVTPYQWELRFTERRSFAWEGFLLEEAIPVRFELWRTGIGTPDDPSDDVRMIPVLNDIDMNGLFNVILSDHPASPGPDDPFTDWIYWHMPADTSPGESGYQSWLSRAQAGDGEPATPAVMGRHVLMNWDGAMGESVAAGVLNAWMPEPGTTFRITTSAGLQAGDSYILDTAHLKKAEDQLAQREPIGITPNPYKAASDYEVSALTDEVRFTNMPRQAVIRVFQLGGTLVRTLRKNSPTRHFTWDLRTDENLPVSSGMYLIYVESDEGDQTIKFGVIKKEALLPVF
ncbi:MAG: hypothetical protein ACI9W4_002783, partial [Rhodothermales bacterium]